MESVPSVWNPYTVGLFADRYRQETPIRAEALAFVERRIDTLQLGMSYVVCAHEIREMHDLTAEERTFLTATLSTRSSAQGIATI